MASASVTWLTQVKEVEYSTSWKEADLHLPAGVYPELRELPATQRHAHALQWPRTCRSPLDYIRDAGLGFLMRVDPHLFVSSQEIISTDVTLLTCVHS
jgi:hypothetical protein